jgi:hypothetical protein
MARLWTRMEQLRAYHGTYNLPGCDLPARYCREWDLLQAAFRLLTRAVDIRDEEEWAELAPLVARPPDISERDP